MLAILNKRTDAGERVFASPTLVDWEENLPVINLHFRGEEIKDTETAPRFLNRVLNVEAEIIAEGNTDEELSDQLDDLCEQLEDLLSRDDSLRDTCDDIYPIRVSDIDVATEGAKPIGKVSLIFAIEYREYAPRSQRGQGVGDFTGIDADWRVGHDDEPPTMEAEDSADDKLDF